MADGESSPSDEADGSVAEKPLDPSGVAQFIRHDRCPRYLKQRFDPGSEPDAREWREAFELMNIALVGSGQEFEADQVEALATNATKVIGPELGDSSEAGVPDISIDEIWSHSSNGRIDQLQAAVAEAEKLEANSENQPYILCYQAPLGGCVGDETLWGEIDCLVLSPTNETEDTEQPAETASTESTTDSDVDDTVAAAGNEIEILTSQSHLDAPNASVVARVLEIKSATKQKPAHHVQVAIYSALLEQILAENPSLSYRIETSILTQETAVGSGESLHPFELPTFSRHEWEFYVEQLLASDGPVDTILDTDLDELSFTLDRICNNCAYQEACATRAVEDPTAPGSLSLLGIDLSIQRQLQEAGVSNIRELSELLPRQENTHPTDEPPTLALPADQQRQLEEALPGSIQELAQRAQVLRGEIDPEYDSYNQAPPLPDKGWVPLPDDRTDNWANIDAANSGELIHVGLFVRPDTAINRVAALGACVYVEAHDEYITVSEIIDAVPDDADVADDVEADLFERFLDQLFDAIETVAKAIGTPEESVIHCYTYTDHETEFLAEGLDRHVDTLPQARAMRGLCSLHQRGHTEIDQSMLSPVQPIITDHFALMYPSQGLLAVTKQFVSGWTRETFDPLEARADDPPLRAIFREQFLNEDVPYLDDDPGIRLHLPGGALSGSQAAEAVDADHPTLAGRYPVRKRSGGQFPLEYIWASTPRHPEDTTPRLTPETVDEWMDDADEAEDEDDQEYKETVNRFYYRTADQQEPLQQRDVEYLTERLSYALVRLVQAIPHKNVYHPKEPVDATSLATFELPVTNLPQAARDYLRIEFGNSRKRTLDHYRQSLRDRARSGRSMPVRCTEIDQQPDGSLRITGELAYDALFDDADTLHHVAQQTRLRSNDGPGSGSWRVLTRMQSTGSTSLSDSDPTSTESGTSERPPVVTTSSSTSGSSGELTVENPEDLKHSPPVLVEDIDTDAGEISLKTFSHRFRSNYNEFRVDHCGWESPVGSNLEESSPASADQSGYVADREPVWIETGEVYMLDPMVDDFGSRKADYALQSKTVEHNVLWQHLQAIRQGESLPGHSGDVVNSDAVEEFLDKLADADECLEPNEGQKAFIRAVDRALVPLHGPPGTGKTSGATAPALLARAYARAQENEQFVGVVVAPSHEAVDAVLDGTTAFLDDWRQSTEGGENLQLVRILPSQPPSDSDRVDAETPSVEVSYASYHSTDGKKKLQDVARDIFTATGAEGDASQYLLFTTPSTWYRTLGVFAESRPEIDGDSAPSAMRYEAGIADVVCVDEASMLDIPQWLLAGSVLKPAGQTLLVGDHRQLSTVSETDWEDTLRKPLEDTKAYLSALEYIHWLNQTVSTEDESDDDDDGEDSTVARTSPSGNTDERDSETSRERDETDCQRGAVDTEELPTRQESSEQSQLSAFGTTASFSLNGGGET